MKGKYIVIGVSILLIINLLTITAIERFEKLSVEADKEIQSHIGKQILKGKDTLKVLYYDKYKGLYMVQDGTLVSSKFINYSVIKNVENSK